LVACDKGVVCCGLPTATFSTEEQLRGFISVSSFPTLTARLGGQAFLALPLEQGLTWGRGRQPARPRRHIMAMPALGEREVLGVGCWDWAGQGVQMWGLPCAVGLLLDFLLSLEDLRALWNENWGGGVVIVSAQALGATVQCSPLYLGAILWGSGTGRWGGRCSNDNRKRVQVTW
jgi:hypothetical protein